MAVRGGRSKASKREAEGRADPYLSAAIQARTKRGRRFSVRLRTAKQGSIPFSFSIRSTPLFLW
ncbi:hypothetical protein GW17_00032067 [Ensete ventricosum]|nr:hypothetical protein GW17_00032067 [Ensete ventricosum]